MGGSASAPMRLLCFLPSAERCGVPAFSGDHDDLDADRLIGALCPRVPGRKRHLMLLGGECYKCVIDGATCDAQTAERVRQFPGPRPAQQEKPLQFFGRHAHVGENPAKCPFADVVAGMYWHGSAATIGMAHDVMAASGSRDLEASSF